VPKGYALSEATTEGIWELRAQGLSEREIARQLRLGQNTVSDYLRALGGIRPRTRRRAERCLSFEEREDLARDRPRALGQTDRPRPRSLPHDDRPRDRPLRRPGPLPRPRSRPRGLGSSPPTAADEARALPGSAPAGRRAAAKGPRTRADRRLAELRSTGRVCVRSVTITASSSSLTR